MIPATVKDSKTGSQYICKSASKTVKDLVCRHKDHPFFKQFYHGPKGIYIDSPRYKEIEALEYTNIQIARSNHYGNTPRRAYTIRKTVTRIQCGYIEC